MKRLLSLALAIGCSSSTPTPTTAVVEDSGADVALIDTAPADTYVDKSATCAKETEFGDALTNAFGRADGTVTAIVAPNVTTCAWPNDDHVVLQMRMHEKIYRMVINVQSSFGDDLRARIANIEHPAIGEPWAEGWHPGVTLDYATTLNVHSSDAAFVPYEMLPLSAQIDRAIELGAKVSVYAWSSGGPSAHKVHRNSGAKDGAIVIEPASGKPRWLLLHFANQTF